MEKDHKSTSDLSGHDRTRPDTPGQDRRVTVDEAAVIFQERGFPRSKRAIRRYCQREHLDCKPIETASVQEQHSISVNSIDVFIKQQKQIYAAIQRRTPPDTSGQDRPRPDSSGTLIPSFLQETLDLLKGEITVKNEQIRKRDEQISELLERDRETHILIQQLQRMLPLAAPKAPQDPYTNTPSQATPISGQDQSEPAGGGEGALAPDAEEAAGDPPE